jgi:hypothetical protein
VYAVHNGTDPFGIAIESVVEDPLMLLLNNIHAGLGGIQFVHTRNETRASGAGRARDEWFATFLSASTFPAPACLGAAGHVTQLTLAPSWTHVRVTNPQSLVELWGELGGAWGLILEVASAAVLACIVARRVGDLCKAPRQKEDAAPRPQEDKAELTAGTLGC